MNSSASSGSSRSPGVRRRPQLSDEVAAHVRNLIMSGGARPGDFVRLDETAAELGVSVTPVREALLTLRGEGLVELVPHRGYVVSPLDRSDIDDIFWLQGRLAERLVERAATLMTAETLAELDELAARFAEAVRAGDGARIEDLEFEFHRTLNRAAGSRKLAWFLHNATRYTPVHFYSDDRSWGTDAVASHERLLQALRTGDVEAAGRETREHFTDGAHRLVEHLDDLGVWC
ncbi:GntR family transcriptional regulator [Rhodococcus rhodochrous]|nr:GntR family transcriptional regulator [Rhodococcus rhodochrous]